MRFSEVSDIGSLIDVIHRFNHYAMEKIRNWEFIFRGDPDARKHGTVVWSDGDDVALTVTPRQNRPSAHSPYNFYNLYMSNADVWDGFPRRDQAHICTTGESMAEAYSHHPRGMWVVIPHPNAKIAIVPADDLWVAFDTPYLSLKEWNAMVAEVLGKGEDLKKITWEDLQNTIDRLPKGLRAVIDDLFACITPEKFSLYPYSAYNLTASSGTGNEVWFSGPALYVSYQVIPSLIEGVK